jgi:predicted alpha/beta hydrolase
MGIASRLKPARGPSASKPKKAEGELEAIEVHTEDGLALRAYVREPTVKCVGVAVLAHAMFARSSQFERPHGRGLAQFLSEQGWRTVACDFRGHGNSGASASNGGRWTYDDLVRRDLPGVVECARARKKRGEPVVVIGHSLGGHVAMAAQGLGVLEADALVAIATNVWLPHFEPSFLRWRAKQVSLRAMSAITTSRGFFPARALRMGSDDESAPYVSALVRAVQEGRWTSDDGRDDYEQALENIKVPVLGIASVADRLNCHPVCAERMLSKCGGEREFHLITHGDGDAPAPGHMALVTGEHARGVWSGIARFLSSVKRT